MDYLFTDNTESVIMYRPLLSGISTGNTLVKIKLGIEFGNSKIGVGCIRGLMIGHSISKNHHPKQSIRHFCTRSSKKYNIFKLNLFENYIMRVFCN